MGRMERLKQFMGYVGWHGLMTEKDWIPSQLTQHVELKRINDHPFSIQTINGVLNGQPGDYLLRDPVSGFVTVLPAQVAVAMFETAPEGLTLTAHVAAEAAESSAQQ